MEPDWIIDWGAVRNSTPVTSTSGRCPVFPAGWSTGWRTHLQSIRSERNWIGPNSGGRNGVHAIATTGTGYNVFTLGCGCSRFSGWQRLPRAIRQTGCQYLDARTGLAACQEITAKNRPEMTQGDFLFNARVLSNFQRRAICRPIFADCESTGGNVPGKYDRSAPWKISWINGA